MIDAKYLNENYGHLIEARCPWCGDKGELHITNTASIYVRCRKCKARHPWGTSHYVNLLNKDLVHLHVMRALDYWNKRINLFK